MLLLAIDTSTETGAVALRNEHGLIGSLTVNVDLTHSEGLMPAIDALLRRAGLAIERVEAVACASGPGSFTGLRVGMAAAQGLAIARDLPCAALPSLEVFAWSMPFASHRLCPLTPARKGWVYARFFEWRDGAPVSDEDELYLTIDDLIARIHEPTILFGPGASPYRDYLRNVLGDQFIEAPSFCDAPRADILSELALREIAQGRVLRPEELTPRYIAPSQAEAKRNSSLAP